GHDVHAEPAAMASRIGIVDHDDRLHRHLTTAQTLRYAAELRLPPDVSAEHRARVVDQVLEELELTALRDTRIGKLPPEARRCAALAVELLTRPTLLVVDEPTAGLDPAQQSHVMGVLRRQADLGCVVVAALSARAPLADLNLCDQVLVLTASGTVAFLGAPLQIEAAMGTTDWSEVLARVSADPDGTHRAYRGLPPTPASSTPPQVAEPWPPAAELARSRQIRLLARRDLRLLFADRAYCAFLAILPFALAGLALLIPGDAGLGIPGPRSTNAHQAIEILAALNLAAVLIGTALTIRTVVTERAIFRREQAVGLSAAAYLGAKILVFGLAAAVLTAVPFAMVVAVRGGPAYGAVLLHNATVELYVTLAVTAIVSAVLGLTLSTLGRSLREVLPLLVPVILASLLFNGSLVQLASTWGVQQLSWFVPAQWGFAAAASTVNLHRLDPLAVNALTWTHYSGWWVFDMAMLLLFGVVAAGLALYRLRPRGPRPAPSREPVEAAR
ncbi:ABC transporter permease, partial [Mycobacterium sp. E1319]|uniref:ABC transporter permease n=2 Tax=unclassified Mycobacterium TaxID=2642494 RepID=UPI000AB5B831